MTNKLWICPDSFPICITNECEHVKPHKYTPSCQITCNACNKTCVLINEDVNNMEISNEHEAKAFYIFLNLERKRHQGDIDRINKDLKALTEKWGFYFTV